MVQLPQGIPGWTAFIAGLLIVAYRIHGIDAPRPWIEWVESRFTAKKNLQFFGFILVVASVLLARYGGATEGLVGWLYVFSLALFFILGLALMFTQNHVRLLVVATAESSDKKIRIASILFTVIGLLWALAPWFV